MELRSGSSSTTAAFAYVVACDGLHSPTRTAMGVPFPDSSYPEEIMLADVKLRWKYGPDQHEDCSSRQGTAF